MLYQYSTKINTFMAQKSLLGIAKHKANEVKAKK